MTDFLVRKYMAVKSKDAKDFSFVDKIVRRYLNRYPWVSIDELISEANWALAEKAEQYLRIKPECGFRQFAYKRIEGAVRDYMRSLNWVNHKGKSRHKVYLFTEEKLAKQVEATSADAGFISNIIAESDKEYLGRLIKFLSKEERFVLKSVLSGKSKKMIAKENSISLYRVRALYQSAIDSIFQFCS